MIRHRYSRWDGTQEPFAPDADQLLDALAEDLFEHGDLERALHDLFRRGLWGRQGQRLPGLRDLLRRVRDHRQDRLDRYDVGSVLDDLRQRLDRVIELEWAAAERAAAEPETRTRGEAVRRTLETLPRSLGGAIRQLARHDFLDPLARQEFQALLDLLRRQMAGQVSREVTDALRGMTPGQQRELREMLSALNRMLRERLRGGKPDFEGFMRRFGHFFGPNPPRSLDELLERMQRQMAGMQSLMAGLSPEQREELMRALQDSLDPGTIREMSELGALMEALQSPSDLVREYPFRGAEALDLDEAMRLMGELQELDGLEQALEQAGRTGDLDRLDGERLREWLGPEAEQALREMRDVARKLEEAGYARQTGDRWELTPRTIRRLGEKALGEVFGRLGRARVGGHRIAPVGSGGEPTGDTKPYEPGEPFEVNLQRSLMNALARRGPGTPVRLALEDFEVDRVEATVSAATVLLLDQSSSMFYQGRWPSAKKVAMALQALIQGQFPRDRLFVVGFSDYAQEIRPEDVPGAEPNMWQQGTNMQHAIRLARRRLAREPAATRQIIMVTDGDPTAHLEDGEAVFSYPPTRRTIAETLKEVRRCTAAGITINTFMLARAPYLTQFVDYVARINRGRAFFAEPGRLGDYILVDYVKNRRRRVG
ncbi:MAG: VWA domain-containing protein [Candidatus Rokubacteria bacterium]|nr:VWA domain-containing protein [Candidatus Rokubacteria bacterium]